MQIIYNCNGEPSLLENISFIATIFTAIASFGIAYQVFIYQKGKDRHESQERLKEIRRGIRLQWFKDTIIQPNIIKIYAFFDGLQMDVLLLRNNKTSEEKIKALKLIKSNFYNFRITFIDLVGAVDENIQINLQNSLDQLLDVLTINLFDSVRDSSLQATIHNLYEKPVNNSKIDLFYILFSYEGHINLPNNILNVT